jgi:glucosamine--fructose-6-phosphate aminotransferase (isomerizing)
MLEEAPVEGAVAVGHTRWATHGPPSVRNAHPHICRDQVALVHNGIIENHEELRANQCARGYRFESDTDTEVVVNEIYDEMQQGKDLLQAVLATTRKLSGAYALGIICASEPGRMIATRRGSPLVVGIGIGEHFIASDMFALLPVTRRFVVLDDGDVADIRRDRLAIYDASGHLVTRPVITSDLPADAADKAGYRHYMLKEIFTQSRAVADTLAGRIGHGQVLVQDFDPAMIAVLGRVRAVDIIACGTSYHAGLVAAHWIESLAGVPCRVEVASEYRYRRHVVPPGTLFVAVSQSGETADTLAAMGLARSLGYLASLVICNVDGSSLTREAQFVMLTRAGPEIGVASTKAFTTQLVVLLLLAILLGRGRALDAESERGVVELLESLPGRINAALELSSAIERLAGDFVHKHHALYLGRGTMLPVAMEGALKLKEISYIHAEAYPAGELKHGPLALVDEDMPVIAVAPNNELLEKLKSNLHEVRARGGALYVFADTRAGVESSPGIKVLKVAPVDDLIAPVTYTVPLQLFAYHIAVLRGADVDQPRNLAKSVTVE